MSRIGKKPVAIPAGVKVSVKDGVVTLYAQWEIIELMYTVEYEVRVDGGGYVPFQGELPEDAPENGKIPYGTTAIEGLIVPEQVADTDRAYGFTTVEEVVNPDGSITVTVYYTYITPAPPVQEESATPPAQEEPVTPPAPPVAPVSDDGLVDIPDERVPLADAPKTGDAMLLYAGMTALSGVGLAGLGLKKKKEDPEA